jgi:hypothetical protein
MSPCSAGCIQGNLHSARNNDPADHVSICMQSLHPDITASHNIRTSSQMGRAQQCCGNKGHNNITGTVMIIQTKTT